jgi:predicted transposase YbfD/YdcC
LPKKTVIQVVESGNHYVFQVKGNQPTLKLSIENTIKGQPPLEESEMIEKRRGKVTEWKTSVYEVTDEKIKTDWDSIRRYIVTEKKVTSHGASITSISYRISDIEDMTAKVFAKGIRGHWGVENKNHWVRDVIFKEDKNRIKKHRPAVNMALMNLIVMNFLRKNIDDSITAAQTIFGATFKRILRRMRT